MSKYRVQGSYKPTKADLKFARQESRETYCFARHKAPGAICAELKLNQSEQTLDPKYPKVNRDKPENYFKTAVGRVPAECNATSLESGIGDCKQDTNYAYHYSTLGDVGRRDKWYRDNSLAVDLKTCQDAKGRWPNDSQLSNCTKGYLDQAAAQSARSLTPFEGLPLYGTVLIGILVAGIGAGLAGTGLYFAARLLASAIQGEQRQYAIVEALNRDFIARQEEQRAALLVAPQPVSPASTLTIVSPRQPAADLGHN